MNALSQDRLAGLAPYVIFVIAAIGLHLTLAQNLSTIGDGRLIGPDSYMRLLRVGELLDTGAWFDHTIERSNAPDGDTLHWTRPFDVILAALSFLLRPLVGAADSLFWAGATVSPLLQIMLSVVAVWAAAPVLRTHRFWLMPVLLAQWPILVYALPGRADHHMLILLAMVVAFGLMLRVIANPTSVRTALAAGAAHGFGLWVSVEAFGLLAVNMAVLAGVWALAPTDPAGRHGRTRQGMHFSLGLALMLGLATILEHAPGRWLVPEYDRVSAVYLAFAVLALIMWWLIAYGGQAIAATAARRVGAMALAGTLASALLIALFPALLAGPFAQVDPRVSTILIDRIAEMLPLWPTSLDMLARFFRYLGSAVIALPALAWLLARRDGGNRPVWAYVALLAVAALVPALQHLRFASGFALIAAVPLAWLIGEGFEALRARMAGPLGIAARAGLVLAVILMPLLLEAATAVAFPKAARLKDVAAAACPVEAIAPVLNGPEAAFAGSRILLANSLGLGPRLIYHTRHGVVATPYHRNTAGVVAAYEIFTATDMDAAAGRVAARGVELILICRQAGRSLWPLAVDGVATLHGRLQDGTPPDWLDVRPLPPAAAARYMLYLVRPRDG